MKKLLIFFITIALNTSAQNTIIRLHITENGIPSIPVRAQMNEPLSLTASYRLINQKTKKAIPIQLLDSMNIVFMLEENLSIGYHSYLVTQLKQPTFLFPVVTEKKVNGLLVKVKQKPVFFYHIKEAMPPPDSPSYYQRSGFIHPLYSPSGKILTDDFPVAHMHQHAIFSAWVNTTFRKTSVDFWNQQAQKGTVEHVRILDIVQGPVMAQITTILRHKSHEFGEVLREKWTLTIYPVDNHFLFDLESQQHNTTNDTLFLNKYHYGGLALRGSRQWNKDDPQNYKTTWNILTSEGIRDSAANATHPRWVDASGKIDIGIAGATIFNHPSNFRYPQAIRVHPVMPYWAFSPVADGAFYIAPGAFYRSQFRYYVHEGRPDRQMIEKHFKQWIKPLGVTVISR